MGNVTNSHAGEAYLLVDGIRSGAKEARHKGLLKIQSYSLSGKMPISPSSGVRNTLFSIGIFPKARRIRWMSWYVYGLAPFVGFACAAVLLFVCASSNLVLAAKEPVGKATNAVGGVRVLRAGGTEEALQGKGSLPLFEGDWVQTSKNSLAQLALGKGVEVAMNESTEFLILSRWEKAKGLIRILRITQGELWIQIQRATLPLEVETPFAIAAMGEPDSPSLAELGLDPYGPFEESPRELLGKQQTEFTISVALDGQTTVQVLEGGVEFGNAFNTWVLPPSTVSVAVRGKRCTRPRLIDVKSTMGWTEALGQ